MRRQLAGAAGIKPSCGNSLDVVRARHHATGRVHLEEANLALPTRGLLTAVEMPGRSTRDELRRRPVSRLDCCMIYCRTVARANRPRIRAPRGAHEVFDQSILRMEPTTVSKDFEVFGTPQSRARRPADNGELLGEPVKMYSIQYSASLQIRCERRRDETRRRSLDRPFQVGTLSLHHEVTNESKSKRRKRVQKSN